MSGLQRGTSPDSGLHWTRPGAWRVADGIYRIPLPLPMDGLVAVSVYLLEGDEGYTLIDGGWDVPEGRKALLSALDSLGVPPRSIRRVLVTHVHRDHYTLARSFGSEFGCDVALGWGEEAQLRLIQRYGHNDDTPLQQALVDSGLSGPAVDGGYADGHDLDDSASQDPDTWLRGDLEIDLGGRRVQAVHTPGHTPGHYVFADLSAGLLYSGDHVLPTITPSIGLSFPTTSTALDDYMTSLKKVVALPELKLAPAHGPVGGSTHARARVLLEHHHQRLALTPCASELSETPPLSSFPCTG